MGKIPRENRQARETRALLRVEMAKPRKAQSVVVREAQLKEADMRAIRSRAGNKKAPSAVKGRI
jgi:hypothetical protein